MILSLLHFTKKGRIFCFLLLISPGEHHHNAAIELFALNLPSKLHQDVLIVLRQQVIHALKTRVKKECPFRGLFDSYIISDTSLSTNLISKYDKLMNHHFRVIHQHVENRANERLNFQINLSQFHSADLLYKHCTHATTFVQQKKSAENKTTMLTAQQ